LVRLGNWTLSASLRWDHYHLITGQSVASPRLGAAWYWPAADMVFRASYDRVFQTPAFENLLLASSAAVQALNTNVLRLPVRPSPGSTSSNRKVTHAKHIGVAERAREPTPSRQLQLHLRAINFGLAEGDRETFFSRSTPAQASSENGRTRPAARFSRSTICCPYCAIASAYVPCVRGVALVLRD